MAENNSSAPLKTAEGAYPALPKPDYPAQFDGHGGEQSSDESYSAEQMRAYAAQAVAAQTPADPMNWPLPCDVTVGHGTMRKGVKLSTLVLRMKALYKMATGEDADEVAARSPEVRARMLAAFQAQVGAKPVVCDSVHIADSGKTATPTLPATEDSSAGDLAHHGMTPRDKATQDQIAAVMLQHGTPEQQLQALATCCNVSPDSIKDMVAAAQAEVQAEPVTRVYLVNTGEVRNGLELYERHDGPVPLAEYETLYTAPQAQPADALTQAALDVLAERRRQVEAEGWTPERDDQYVHGDMASAAGCYAMFTQAYPKGDPHHSWPWDKAWWKPSKDARRNRVKACALLLAEIERLDRAAMAAAQEGGNAAKEA
ncbi:hypothetical protein [Comamonas squillarum]|uniref:Uncharacterized protein n=1 Tax=Comamonas squillarum TaxID=2977320 RepID=A0ABY5ZYN8_9BURK|nr:hypothetical protein [Comamonas sp. PR12]UXC19120.1 hypothetical protein N4T19_03060 [Comamonas sp. PR12]